MRCCLENNLLGKLKRFLLTRPLSIVSINHTFEYRNNDIWRVARRVARSNAKSKKTIITSNLTYVLYKDFLGEASRDSNLARPVWSLNCQAIIL